MGIDYTALASTALALVTQNGRAVTFVAQNETPADGAKEWRGATDPTATPGATELAASAVFVPPSSATSLGLSVDSSDLVKRSEAIMIAATATADLTDYDEVVDGSTRWRIVGVEKLRPGSTTLLYFVGVEGI